MSVERKTIGVFISIVDRYYQQEIWQSILEQCRLLDFNVLFFSGSPLESPMTNEKENNIIYHLAKKNGLDGIISISGTLSNYITLDHFNKFIGLFPQLPIIHTSIELPSAHCLHVDNYESMRQIVLHLIQEHSYEKYAYIAGPHNNSEAIQRTQAFQDVMKEHEISVDNYKTFEGNFGQESASRAISYFYDTLKFEPNVIVCANDEMAIGALRELVDRQIEIPGKVAFTGFDNIDNAQSFYPAFTTVDQPLDKIGVAAVQRLHDIFQGHKRWINESFIGPLIVRESCGCHHQNKIESPMNPYAMVNNESLLSYIEIILNSGVFKINENHKNQITNCIKYLDQIRFESFSDTLFLENFRELCLSHIESGKVFLDMDKVIIAFRRLLMDNGMLDKYPKLHEVFYDIKEITNDIVVRNERRESLAFHEMYYNTTEMAMELNDVTDENEMFKVITTYVSSYKLDDLYVCLFEEPMKYLKTYDFDYPEKMIMKYGFKDGLILDECDYETESILPSIILDDNQRNEYVFFPLSFKKDHFGFIICNVKTTNSPIFKTIKDQISNTLGRLLLNRKLEAYNKQLSLYIDEIAMLSIRDSLTNCLNRRGVDEYIESVIKSARITGDYIWVMYGDMDDLKGINDQYGHHEGDYAIKAIADILKEAVGNAGELGRFGGDEFVAIVKMPKDKEYGKKVMDKVDGLLDSYNQRNNRGYVLSISIGEAWFNPNGTKTLEEAFKKADQDLYLKKGLKKHRHKL